MLIVKPDGTLTVTYTRQASSPVPSPPPAAAPVLVGLADRLGQLDQAKTAGLISEEEHAAKRAKIIEEA